ncbi:MarR family winged helix-turn-helix transcriptional regulator [Sanguibacter antarcticus]|uniref:DNA-binding MarR family transcriptional regulator n=1 Tax=Sanguibacter antarcticus TaxID=372484 RepID=A0A2A9DZR1_9MICO|nr:MarR family transcriptional regulator [Sanguibacter antarcticus]PFG32287.1 DNA-binding MarR family transcriptional regulator [Sanguibacter antarcticus]
MTNQTTGQISGQATDLCGPDTLAGQLRVALTRVSRRLRAQKGDAELTEGQLAVLFAIRKLGPMTPGALAEHENMRPPSMTRIVSALADAGLVLKVGDATDRRLVVVEMTALGASEIAETKRRRNQWLTEKLDGLTAEDRQTLARASELLTEIAAR